MGEKYKSCINCVDNEKELGEMVWMYSSDESYHSSLLPIFISL